MEKNFELHTNNVAKFLHFPHGIHLVCYRAHFSVPETVESICVVICLRSNHKMTGLYLITVVREAHRCGGRGWQAYDAMVRQQAAGDMSTDWSKLNSSLYASTLLACANGSGKSCSHSLMTDHTVGECVAAALSRPGRNLRTPQRGYGEDDKRSG